MRKKETWYEVFVTSKDEGTRTIGSFDTLKEAREFKEKKSKIWGSDNLGIDKWRKDFGSNHCLGEIDELHNKN